MGIARSGAACAAGALALVLARDPAGFAVLALGWAGLGVLAGASARPGYAARTSTRLLPTRMS
jgi:hypothetical protein